MPFDPLIIRQVIPTCPDNGGSSADETETDRGNVEIDDDCCRSYGSSVTISGPFGTKTLYYEGEISSCSKTGTGVKTYSSDSFKLCGSLGTTFTGLITGSGTIVGTTLAGTGSGFLQGSVNGLLETTVSGTATSPSSASFAAAITGILTASTSGTASLSGGSSSFPYTVTSPSGVTLTGVTTITVTGGGTGFQFRTVFSGTSPSEYQEAYWHLTWTNCKPKGMLFELRNSDDDSVILQYRNDFYPVKNGTKTIVNRLRGNCDHPCIDGLTYHKYSQATVHSWHEAILCVVPNLQMGRCLDGYSSHDVTVATDAGSGLSGSIPAMSATGRGEFFPLADHPSTTSSGAASSVSGSATGRLTIFELNAGLDNVTATVSINTTVGTYLASLSGNPCQSNPDPAGCAIVNVNGSQNWTADGTDTIDLSGVGLPAYFESVNPQVTTGIAIIVFRQMAAPLSPAPSFCSDFTTPITFAEITQIYWSAIVDYPGSGPTLMSFLLDCDGYSGIPDAEWSGSGVYNV